MNAKYAIIAQYYDYTGDQYRAKAYRKAIKENSTHLRLISITDPKFNTYLVLSKVVGAGPVTIKKWIKDGITSIQQLKQRVANGYPVSTMVKYGIKYYNDFLQPIPRQTCQLIGNTIIKHLGNGLIVGSYRRRATQLKDIDILTTSDVPIDTLPNIHLVTNGEQKQSIIYIHNNKAHRVDILRTTLQEAPTALFYFTGSKDFNRRTRLIAKQHDYTLSEHGLFNANHKRIPITSEKDIFDKLGIPYVSPLSRNAAY
jgi:DNA polymerase/3'-5' exonuclease PolX